MREPPPRGRLEFPSESLSGPMTRQGLARRTAHRPLNPETHVTEDDSTYFVVLSLVIGKLATGRIAATYAKSMGSVSLASP